MTSFIPIKGLYILSSPLLKKMNTIKFGMSMELQSRINNYKSIFNSPYYYACYEFNHDYNKLEIYYIEQKILYLTKNNHNSYFSSEYRHINDSDMDNIIKKVLDEFNVEYVYHNPITFNIISNNKKSNYDNMIYTNRFLKVCTHDLIKMNPSQKEHIELIKMDPFQKECMDSINNKLNITNKCCIEAFCGSGKSIIALNKMIYYDFSIIVVPNLLLIEQFYYGYVKNTTYSHFMNNYHHLCICSDKLVNGTTNLNTIITFMNNNNKKIILVTYMSVHLLFASFDNINKFPDLIVFDECHHVNNNISCIINKFDNIKYLFMSATVPVNGVDYGDMVYKFTYKNAIDNNVCKQFDVIVDVYDDIKKEDIYKSIIKNSIMTGNHNILTYHNSVKGNNGLSVNDFYHDIDNIKNVFNNIVSEYTENVKNIHVNKITSDSINKMEILKEFSKSSTNELQLLLSCKTINEGLDIDTINCICFCEPKKSIVDIIQNIGRITRNKKRIKYYKKPLIIIPTSNNYNYKVIFDVINLLKNGSNITLYVKGNYYKTINNESFNEKQFMQIIPNNSKQPDFELSTDTVAKKIIELLGRNYVDMDKRLLKNYISTEIYDFYRNYINDFHKKDKKYECYLEKLYNLKREGFKESIINTLLSYK